MAIQVHLVKTNGESIAVGEEVDTADEARAIVQTLEWLAAVYQQGQMDTLMGYYPDSHAIARDSTDEQFQRAYDHRFQIWLPWAKREVK